MAEAPNSRRNQNPPEERVQEAINFVKKAQERLQPADFKDFTNLMICFKYQKFSRALVAETAQSLFKGDQELIAGMNSYLPERYKIANADGDRRALDFLNKVRTTYQQDNDTTYRLFLEIIMKYRADIISFDETIKEVKELLKDSTELLVEFSTFYPTKYQSC